MPATTRFHIADLNVEAGRLISAALAPNTKKAYAAGLARFKFFRQLQGWPLSWPPSVTEIILYLASLSLSVCSYRTAVLYLAAISFQCKSQSVYDTTKHFLVGKALQGFQKLAKDKRARLPITSDILKGLLTKLPAVCLNEFEILLFQAAFSMAFFGFFRVGEITGPNCKASVLHKLVSIQDVQCISDGVLKVKLRFSKTDQLGKGVIIMLAKQSDPILCPVRAIQSYLSMRPPSLGPLLIHQNGRVLTRYQFSAVLRKALAVAYPSLSSFSTHSFRLGAATTAARMGLSVEKIKALGRWSSNAYKTYIQ